MKERSYGLLELNAAVLLWGGTAMFAKWIALPAFQISALRSVVAVLSLVVLLVLRGGIGGLRSARDGWMMIVIGLALAGHWVTYFHAIQMSTVAVGILALHTYPVMTAIIEPAVYGTSMRWADMGLAAAVFVGVLILVPEFSLDNSVTQGVLWGILSAALFTVRNLISKKYIKVYSGAKIMTYQLATCCVVLLPWGLTCGEPVTGRSLAQLLILGTVFTALPQTLFTNSLRHLSAKTVSVIATLLPVYGAAFAAALLGEVLTPRTWVGGLIILAAVLIETLKTVRAKS